MRQVANISELNRLTGIDRTTLAKRLNHLTPATTNGKKGAKEYFLDEVLAVIVGALKAKYGDDNPKIRRELAEAEKSEIKCKQLRDELVPIEAVRSSAASLVGALRKRCMEAVPIVAKKIAGETEREEVEIEIRTQYASIFEELRSHPDRFLNIPVEPE